MDPQREPVDPDPPARSAPRPLPVVGPARTPALALPPSTAAMRASPGGTAGTVTVATCRRNVPQPLVPSAMERPDPHGSTAVLTRRCVVHRHRVLSVISWVGITVHTGPVADLSWICRARAAHVPVGACRGPTATVDRKTGIGGAERIRTSDFSTSRAAFPATPQPLAGISNPNTQASVPQRERGSSRPDRNPSAAEKPGTISLPAPCADQRDRGPARRRTPKAAPEPVRRSRRRC